MKKYLLAAVLVLASGSAMADRVVSVTNASPYDGNLAGSSSKLTACENAKYFAAGKASSDEQVESYSSCDCEQRPDKKTWMCSVDVTLAKKH